jgi:hypothetical protein
MKHGPLPITAINIKDMNAMREIFTAEDIKAWRPVNGNLEKGQASFHNPMTVHGSNPDKSDNWRWASVLNYFADGILSHSNDEILQGFTKKGTPMGGKFHPLVFDAKMVE